MMNSESLSRRYDETLLKINASDLYLLQTLIASWKHIWSRSISTKRSLSTTRSIARYVSITFNAILTSNDDDEIVWLRMKKDVWDSFFDMMSWSRLAMLCWTSLIFEEIEEIAHYTQSWSLNVTRWANTQRVLWFAYSSIEKSVLSQSYQEDLKDVTSARQERDAQGESSHSESSEAESITIINAKCQSFARSSARRENIQRF